MEEGRACRGERAQKKEDKKVKINGKGGRREEDRKRGKRNEKRVKKKGWKGES